MPKEPRSKATFEDHVPPPHNYTCSYEEAKEVLVMVASVEADYRYHFSESPAYFLESGTTETKATMNGQFFLVCNRRRHTQTGEIMRLSCGEIWYSDDGRKFIREALDLHPVASGEIS